MAKGDGKGEEVSEFVKQQKLNKNGTKQQHIRVEAPT